jgi:2-polyprenyl-6-methoxyphenol hydroxylase-like FAD-dependent oxidoreductase
MMLGYLLARAGIDVTVLEKHKDFLRDFRGDTIHPSTFQIMYELGLLDEFLKLPHARVRYVTADIGDKRFVLGDFSHVTTHSKFLGLMPQWDFLDFLAAKAGAFPDFHLLMQTEARDLLAQNGRIAGLLATGPNGNIQIQAGLTVAADGRGSVLRDRSGLTVKEIGAPFDVLWLRLPRAPEDPVDVIGRIKSGQFFVMIYRGDYWQCALVVPKGAFGEIKAEGLTKFRARLKDIAGFAAGRVDEAITDFNQVKLLTVAVNRLEKWARPGLVCIGDAAHAMSPVGGVGINLAIQDAVATANILGPILQKEIPRFSDLRKVQKRREFPTRFIQAIQVQVQNRILAPTLKAGSTIKPPLLLELINRCPLLQRILAQIVGVGIRPEHVRLGRA